MLRRLCTISIAVETAVLLPFLSSSFSLGGGSEEYIKGILGMTGLVKTGVAAIVDRK